MQFLEYELTSPALCMGERVKGGIIRPCARTIRYSQISGALRATFGREVHAVGHLVNDGVHNMTEYLIYAPRDRVMGLSKVPLQVEFLTNVLGKVFIRQADPALSLPERFEITLGGFLSKGFGKCVLVRKGIIDEGSEDFRPGTPPEHFVLNVRLPESVLPVFNVQGKRPVYGYLFEPTSATQGRYVRALFEGSVVLGPRFLLKRVRLGNG